MAKNLIMDDDFDMEPGADGSSMQSIPPAAPLAPLTPSVKQDSMKISQAAPMAAPSDKPAPISMLTEEDMKNARDQKAKLGLMGAVADNLSNRQSFGNFFLGRMNPHVDGSGFAKTLEGNVDQGIKDKLTAQEQALKQPAIAYMQQATDPDSDVSKATVQAHQAMLQKYAQGLGKTSPQLAETIGNLVSNMDGKSAYQVNQMISNTGIDKIMSQEDMTTTKNQMMAALAGARLAQGDKRIAMAQDNQAANVANTFDKDSNLQAINKQRQSIQRGMHTIATVDKLTPQLFNEIQMDIANALSGGKAAAVSTQNKVEFESLNTQWAGLMQRIKNKPQDIDSPELKQYITQVLARLDDAYAHNMEDRANQLSVGRTYANNPSAQQAMEAKRKSYEAPQSQGDGLPGVGTANASQGQDPKVAAWAKTYNYPYDKAEQILRSRGYGK